MTDNYIRSTVLGVIIGMSSLIVIYMLFETILKPATPEVPAPKSNFEVVDKYKDCDLLRWSNRGLSEYKYVLYCPGN
jgi:hypothetical protein